MLLPVWVFLCFIRVIYDKWLFYCILNILDWCLVKGCPTSTNATAAIEEPEQTNKAHNMAASNNRNHTHDHSIIACSHHL